MVSVGELGLVGFGECGARWGSLSEAGGAGRGIEPDASGVVIEVSGLRMAYDGFEAVRGVDLRVWRGKIFTFLGPAAKIANEAVVSAPLDRRGLRYATPDRRLPPLLLCGESGRQPRALALDDE